MHIRGVGHTLNISRHNITRYYMKRIDCKANHQQTYHNEGHATLHPCFSQVSIITDTKQSQDCLNVSTATQKNVGITVIWIANVITTIKQCNTQPCAHLADVQYAIYVYSGYLATKFAHKNNATVQLRQTQNSWRTPHTSPSGTGREAPFVSSLENEITTTKRVQCINIIKAHRSIRWYEIESFSWLDWRLTVRHKCCAYCSQHLGSTVTK